MSDDPGGFVETLQEAMRRVVGDEETPSERVRREAFERQTNEAAAWRREEKRRREESYRQNWEARSSYREIAEHYHPGDRFAQAAYLERRYQKGLFYANALLRLANIPLPERARWLAENIDADGLTKEEKRLRALWLRDVLLLAPFVHP